MPPVKRVAAHDKVHFAREQRREMTPSEAALWQALRGSKLGVKFRRQHAIGDFVLDFYCDEACLAVELDGEPHERQGRYDSWRDEQLAEKGVRVVRIASADVHTDLPGVLDTIRSNLTT